MISIPENGWLVMFKVVDNCCHDVPLIHLPVSWHIQCSQILLRSFKTQHTQSPLLPQNSNSCSNMNPEVKRHPLVAKHRRCYTLLDRNQSRCLLYTHGTLFGTLFVMDECGSQVIAKPDIPLNMMTPHSAPS